MNAAAYNVVAFDIQAERAAMLHEETSIRSYSTISEMESENSEMYVQPTGADANDYIQEVKRSSLTHQSLEWIRQQGKVVIVGDMTQYFPRNLLFAKEAQILIPRAAIQGDMIKYMRNGQLIIHTVMYDGQREEM